MNKLLVISFQRFGSPEVYQLTLTEEQWEAYKIAYGHCIDTCWVERG